MRRSSIHRTTAGMRSNAVGGVVVVDVVYLTLIDSLRIQPRSQDITRYYSKSRTGKVALFFDWLHRQILT